MPLPAPGVGDLHNPAAFMSAQRIPGALAGVLLLAGCDEPGPPPPATDSRPAVRPLNEIPLEQLRLFLRGHPDDWRHDTPRTSGKPEPPAALPTPPDSALLDLPPVAESGLGKLPLRETIASRRSRREFSSEPLALGELSFLVWAAQGVTHTERDAAGGMVRQLRSAPSAGARYPLETFLAVHRVEGLTPGLYHYRPPAHQLALLRKDPGLSVEMQTACYGNPMAGEAAVVFIWSAVPARTEWKYGYLAHRMIAMEAGHACQNLYLAAESINAGACALLGYHQPALDSLLGVDGNSHFTLYLACVGKPAPPANHTRWRP